MVSGLLKQYKTLCAPSQFYLLVSLLSIVLMVFQNLGNSKRYCVGRYNCDIDFHNVIIFLAKIAYVFVWTIIFDSLCKNGYKTLAWAIILVPVILMFVLISLFFLTH